MNAPATKLSTKSVTRGEGSNRKHRQLRLQLVGQIVTGTYRPGDILPGEHQLAEMMRVSRTTVRQTLGDMEREGFVHRVRGKGTIVAERNSEQSIANTASLALVVPDVATGYYPTLIKAFERSANDLGRPILVCNSNNDVDKQASHLMRMMDQGVAGVLLNPSTLVMSASFQVRIVQKAGIPIVLLHRGIPDAVAPVLELPTREIGRRAAQLMLDTGHRRVAFMASQRYMASESMEQGFREILSAAGIELSKEHVHYGTMRSFTTEDYQAYERELEESLTRLMAAANRPTAVFLTFDATAEIIYLIAGRMGLRVPEDLSIVCFGGSEREGAVMRRLTAITVDEAAAARQAIELLTDMQNGRLPIRNQQIIPMQLGISKGQTLDANRAGE